MHVSQKGGGNAGGADWKEGDDEEVVEDFGRGTEMSVEEGW